MSISSGTLNACFLVHVQETKQGLSKLMFLLVSICQIHEVKNSFSTPVIVDVFSGVLLQTEITARVVSFVKDLSSYGSGYKIKEENHFFTSWFAKLPAKVLIVVLNREE